MPQMLQKAGNFMNIAIITGASSGIGAEFALQFDNILKSVDEFWLIARRKDRLDELSEKLNHKTRVITMDLTDAMEREELKELLRRENPVVRVLVNCAGYGIMGKFSEMELKEQTGMLDLNCMALTEVTYLCIPYMRRKSRIIQLASSAAFLPQPGFAVYAATKAYVLSFSRALREELRPKEIVVTAVCPGPVRTEFFDTAERYGKTLAIKKLTFVNADKVVREAIEAAGKRKAMSVCSPWIRLFWFFTKVLPHGFLLKIVGLLK